MRRIFEAFLLFAALLAARPVFATNGMRMIGFGPVQGSMGGVGVGATLDGSALASNPATRMSQYQLDMGATYRF